MAQAVQHDLRAVRRPFLQLGGERSEPLERPGAVPVGHHEQGVAADAELLEHAVQHVEPPLVRWRHVVNGDEQPGRMSIGHASTLVWAGRAGKYEVVARLHEVGQVIERSYGGKLARFKARIPPHLERAISRICRKAYSLLHCRDWCRIDVRLDEAEVPSILELNPLPGIMPNPAENSCFPKAARAAGMSYDRLIQTVLAIAARRCGLTDMKPSTVPACQEAQ